MPALGTLEQGRRFDRLRLGRKAAWVNHSLRVLCVLILSLAGLIPVQAASVAQSSTGSELVEAVAAEATGAEAFLTLQSLEGFPAHGGEVVIEPGTTYEEVLTYSTTEREANRLIGLTRSAPLAHAAGVFVQAPLETPDSEPSPSDAPTSDPEPVPEQHPADSQDAAAQAPSQCGASFAVRSCGEVGEGALGEIEDPPSTEGVCNQLTSMCDQFQEILHGSNPDPCTVATGATCDETLKDVIDGTRPDACVILVGQTCDELVQYILEAQAPEACKSLLHETCNNIAAGPAASGYLCVVNPLLPCLGAGHMGAEIIYYEEDGTVIFEDALTIGADGTISTDEIAGLRLPKRGSALVRWWWEQKTLLGARAYRFVQAQSWKWDHGEITDQYHYAYAADADPFQNYIGTSAHHSGPEGPGCIHGPRPEEGPRECHSSWYQGHFCNEFPFVGCVSHTYPEVLIFVDGWGGADGCAWRGDDPMVPEAWQCSDLQ